MNPQGIIINTVEAVNRLKSHRAELTKQQFKTIKGQIVAGQPEAAMKGLEKILRKKVGA